MYSTESFLSFTLPPLCVDALVDVRLLWHRMGSDREVSTQASLETTRLCAAH